MSTKFLEFITKKSCPLCEKAEPVVGKLAAELGMDVVKRDIGEEPALRQEFWARVPVVRLGDTVVAEGRIDERSLRRMLLR